MLKTHNTIKEFLNFNEQLDKIKKLRNNPLIKNSPIIFFLTNEIKTSRLFDNRNYFPYAHTNTGIEEMIFMHQITGNGGTTSYIDLKNILKKGFDSSNLDLMKESEENFFIMNKNTLAELNYQVLWMYGRKDYMKDDRYAILTTKAIPKYSFETFESLGHYSDRVSVEQVNQKNINTVIISLSKKGNPIKRKKEYDEELKSINQNIKIIYLNTTNK